ncbi:uncharacterized protein LY79DRAFT_136128 [Colletotrichum navitas]|uniref:Uncharacterized protein n=1 Tax=Colletotrichum navitas TaxID=681940 RepID=A0AAD8UWU4_9PEZI|nr:uncharacterized protein LY79DRAFT_136128 [Colletotrichum navitas]KAK1564264.1 hypothetical protein LY79DRAFT_136128 [Colletotrichum navitas]
MAPAYIVTHKKARLRGAYDFLTTQGIPFTCKKLSQHFGVSGRKIINAWPSLLNTLMKTLLLTSVMGMQLLIPKNDLSLRSGTNFFSLIRRILATSTRPLPISLEGRAPVMSQRTDKSAASLKKAIRKGYTARLQFDTNMSHQIYLDAILGPYVKEWPEEGKTCVLEEDNDSGHGPSHPDLSPIEKAWIVPKQYIAQNSSLHNGPISIRSAGHNHTC